MEIATLTFDRCDGAADWSREDADRLRRDVMERLERHFGTFQAAAEAQTEYQLVCRAIETDNGLLFGLPEAARAGLASHSKAATWQAFQREAFDAIAPFGFSIRFRFT